jgi:hypothetical protein
MAERLYRFVCLAALAFWMGGFTFYALVVIPTGNHLLGSIRQGLLTQQVTHWMNLLGILSLLILLPSARHRKWSAISWLVMAVSLALLFWLHGRLDVLIDASARIVVSENFDRWHRAYLVAVTIQWFASLLFLWTLCGSLSSRANGRQGPAVDGSLTIG